jgi:DNA repair exonuclease SbcCD ATPase subunit
MTRKTVKQRLEEIGALRDDIDESVHVALDMLDAERAKKAHPWSNAQLAAGMRIAELEQELEAARAERDRVTAEGSRLLSKVCSERAAALVRAEEAEMACQQKHGVHPRWVLAAQQRDAALARAEKAEAERDDARARTRHISGLMAERDAALARAEKAEAENWKDAERRAADLVVAVRRSEQAALARVAQLEGALRVMLERFVGLVASGDAGSWDPESEPEVVAARAALNTEEGT